MKKKIIVLFFLCISVSCLWSCKAGNTPQPRVVTQVDIDWSREGVPISRHYTDTEKMEAILLYLRLVRQEGPPKTNPDELDGETYRIAVSLSDGQQHIYQQKKHRYFRRDSQPWQTISAEQAARLYALMRQYQSDL